MGVVRGQFVKEQRLKAGLTQPGLAQLADISVRALREIEQGRVTRPHPGSLRRLADALGLSPADRSVLLNGKPDPGSPGEVSIRILGPLQVSLGGTRLAISSPAQQRLLALLALESDRFVTAEEIADLLWDLSPPTGWRNRVHVLVNQLRQLLEPGRERRAPSTVLQARFGGYRLGLRDCVDAVRFSALVGAAQKSTQDGTPQMAFDLYLESLGSWRGRLLSGSDGRLSTRPSAEMLQRERVSATLAFADLAHELGQADQAVMWLQAIAVEEPLHEGLHSRLMIALSATGQQNQALRLYRDLRTRLTEELGVDPAPETQAVHRKVLGQSGPKAGSARLPRPAQLPMATPLFAGRDDVAAQLVEHLTGPSRAGELPAPRIIVLHGMAGVGKTATSLHVAHLIRQRYPDGQLFVDLQGERTNAVPVHQVLSSFLRALGVPYLEIPTETSDRAALLRSSLAGRRVLMVLDDARSSEQVLPLLPADIGNDVIVTARNPLIELPVTRFALPPLSIAESVSVLARLVPPDVLSYDSAPATRIASFCGGLPLALRVVAGRLNTGTSPEELAQALGDPGGRVGELYSGQMAVRSSLESADRALSPLARMALRRLGTLPSTAFPAWAVEVVLDSSTHDAKRVLSELVDANLVTPVSKAGRSGRHHALHDLVKLFASEQADDSDRRSTEDVAVQWFHLAERVARNMTRRRLHGASLELPAAPRQITAIDADPRAWFDREYPHLMDTMRWAAANGHARLAAGLMNAMAPYFHARYLNDQWQECIDLTITSAQATGDKLAWAFALESSVLMNIRRAQNVVCLPVIEQGLILFEQAGDRHGHNLMLYHLMYVKRRLGLTDEVLEISETVLRTYQELGDWAGQAATHQALGVLHREYTQQPDQAQTHFETAIALAAIDPTSIHYAQTCYGLAALHLQMERPAEAEPYLLQAIEILRANDDALGISAVLNRLSDVWITQDRYDDALEALEESMGLAEQAGQRETQAHVQTALYRLNKRRGRVADCIRHLETAAELYRSLDTPLPLESTLEELERLRQLPSGAAP